MVEAADWTSLDTRGRSSSLVRVKREAPEEVEGTKSPALGQRCLVGRVSWGCGGEEMRAPTKMRQIKSYWRACRTLYFSPKVPTRRLEASGSIAGAAHWTVIRSKGRTHLYRGHVKRPTTARVELYGGPVQSVADEGEGLNRGQPGVHQRVIVNPPSGSRQVPKTLV